MGLSNITVLTGDGSFGLPDQAPFDRILVTAAAEDPPGPLLAQLKVGGTMVVPVGQSDTVQSLIRVTRTEAGSTMTSFCPCASCRWSRASRKSEAATPAPARGAGKPNALGVKTNNPRPANAPDRDG
jgi:protein-L-isoaspartate O-methyltransferase